MWGRGKKKKKKKRHSVKKTHPLDQGGKGGRTPARKWASEAVGAIDSTPAGHGAEKGGEGNKRKRQTKPEKAKKGTG